MNPEDTLAYVKANAQALDLPLDEAAAQRVAAHLGRTFGMVAQLTAYPLAADAELAEIFRPAPYASAGGKP